MNNLEEKMLENIDVHDIEKSDAYSIRLNGKGFKRKVNPYINIVTKEDKPGIDIIVKDNTLIGVIDIPVIITESGLTDVVYNDFYIGKNSNITITAGCGIHNDKDKNAQHDGIHRFFVDEKSKVKYLERHYGEGKGSGKKVLNPTTEVYLKKDSYMVMNTSQLEGVDDTIRVTKAVIEEGATLIVNEKLLTAGNQKAVTKFIVELKGKNSSCNVTSRSIATEESYQEFNSNLIGLDECYGHVECDAILKDKGSVKAIPEIYAKDLNANLVHEAAIGKIAGDQLMKLMSLGLTEKEAEEVIIKGFLK